MLLQGGAITCQVIANRFEVSNRTAQRLVEFLRDRMHAPIQWDAHARTYKYMDRTFELPAAVMSEGEAIGLILAHHALLARQATPLGSRLWRALDTLRGLLPETVSVSAGDLLAHVSYVPLPAARAVDSETLDTMAEALERRKTVRMDYYSIYRNERTQRKVDVYHITHRRGDWYAVGWCHLRKALRIFALSRIRSIRRMSASYRIPADFDAEQLFKDSLGVITGREPCEAILLFDADEARWVRERTWHTTQTVEQMPDGALRLELTIVPTVELKQWILSFGRHVRVLAPAELARDIADEHCAAAQFSSALSV